MENLKNILGAFFGLWLIGSIIYLNARDGDFTFVLIFGALFLIIFLISIVQNNRVKEEQRINDFKKKAEIEKRKRIEKIEKMSENEFISFVKYNRNELNKHFNNGGVIGLGHGGESMRWESSKFIIVSTIETNDFNEFINIYRKSDNEKIFSGSWGYDFD